MVDTTPLLPGLSPVSGKRVIARFNGGEISSDGGLLLLRAVEERIGLADRRVGCLIDTYYPGRVRRSMADILRFRMLMIAGGYEDGSDATSLRHDPIFKMAAERLSSEADLCSQPRMEKAPKSASRARCETRNGAVK